MRVRGAAWLVCFCGIVLCCCERPADAQQARPSDLVGGPLTLRPGAALAYDAFGPFSPLFGYPAPNLGFPQPLGHQRIETGPNGYVYRPVTDLAALVSLAAGDLRAGRCEMALVQLQPVLTEQPADGQARLLESQALFALGRYGEAAESLHSALAQLPRERWGEPLSRLRDYFPSVARYTEHLRALEAYARQHPREAAPHFLLGYYYGYGGYRVEGARELDRALGLLATGGRPPREF